MLYISKYTVHPCANVEVDFFQKIKQLERKEDV